MLIKFDQPEQEVTAKGRAIVGFLLDGSGSMTYYKEETIRGYNWYLRDMKNELAPSSHLKMRVFHSSSQIEEMTDGELIYALPLNRLKYQCFGGTPLYDAMMTIIKSFDAWLLTAPEPKPIVIVQTDGEDTSSRTEPEHLRAMIKNREKDGWQFILIAMGTDGRAIGAEMGIAEDAVLDYKTGKIMEAFKSTARLTVRAAGGEKAVFQLEDRRRQK